MTINIHRSVLSAIVLAACALLVEACGDSAAERLARQTAQATTALSQQVDLKVNAEKTFYANEQDAILHRSFGCSWCYNPAPKTPPGDSPKPQLPPGSIDPDTLQSASAQVCPQGSLYFLSLANDSESDADITAAKIHEDKGGTISAALAFEQRGLDEEAATYSKLMQQYQAAQKQLAAVQQIPEQADKLKTVQTDATTLASTNTALDNAQSLYQIGVAVQKQLQSKATPTAASTPSAH